MTVITKEYASLGELSKDERINTNKSKLTYYAKEGLIFPRNVVGGMQIYNVAEVLRRLKIIKSYQAKGLTLKEIGAKLK